MRIRGVILFSIFVLSACDSPDDLLRRVADYEEACNRHDVDTVLSLYAEDARLEFGPLGTIEGKDRIRGVHEYDRAIDAELLFENCSVEYRAVTCRAVENNQWLVTAGLEPLVYSASIFEFNRRGQIETTVARMSPQSAQVLGQVMARFNAWARKNAAWEYSELFRPDGSFEYSYDSGGKILELLRQWRADSAAGDDPESEGD